jgi:hypothetical protein
MIKEAEEFFTFITGNTINKKDEKEVTEWCDYVNSLDKAELEKIKDEKFNIAVDYSSSSKLGLIKIALISGYPLNYKVTSINENESFYVISVRVNRQN